jgi:DNA-directed RNA polymerase specialized sigma24 family protein
MSSEGSITRWLGPLQAGDPAAVQQLWERYFPRLVGLARKKLKAAPRRAADEEDVALSAFDSFCRNAEGGKFPQLLDRDSLWRLLVVIATRKVAHMRRDATRLKRGGEHADAEPDTDLALVLSREPDPEIAAQMVDACRHLLGLLGNPELEAVALWRMEGYSVEEIAARLNYAPRSIKRKLQMIRALWEEEIGP